MKGSKKLSRMGEPAWILGILLCSLGVCFSAKSGFGVSMVVAPAYVLYRKASLFLDFFSFGVGEYVLQGALVVLLCLVLRRFKWKYLLSFGTAVLYGVSLDGWRLLFGENVYGELWQRGLSCAFGALVTALAIALFCMCVIVTKKFHISPSKTNSSFSSTPNSSKTLSLAKSTRQRKSSAVPSSTLMIKLP